jgi:polar amino acid transport system permease protein
MSSQEWAGLVQPLWEGLQSTLQVFGGAAVLATVLGLVIALARLSRWRLLRYAATVFVEFFRGTAALVQLFWVFYALPLVLGLPLPPLWAAWIVIGCNQGAYLSEAVRGAINSVPAAQIEAAVAINLKPSTRWRRVILPQAVPVIVPNYINHMITVLKETAIVSLIGIHDMTHVANTLRTEYSNTTLIFLSIAVVYLMIALLIAAVGRWLERRVDIYRDTQDGRRRRFATGRAAAS